MVHSRLVVSGKLRKAGQDVGRLSEATLFTPGRTAVRETVGTWR